MRYAIPLSLASQYANGYHGAGYTAAQAQAAMAAAGYGRVSIQRVLRLLVPMLANG